MDSNERAQGYLAKMGQGSLEAAGGSSRPGGGDAGAIKVLAALSGLLLLSGAEALKVLLRRNIGLHALGTFNSIVASLAFGGCSFTLYKLSISPQHTSEATLFLAGSIFYAILAVGTLCCGISEHFRAKKRNEVEKDSAFFRGESMFFNFPPNDEKKQKNIYLFYEPLTCLLISGLLMFLHPYIGIPFLVASISFLFNEWSNIVIKPAQEKSREQRQRDEFDRKNLSVSYKKPFTVEE